MVIFSSPVKIVGVDYSDQRPMPDPSDFSLNGELATPKDLEDFEALARQLLENTPTEVYYEYGYRLDSGLTILFGTVVSDASDESNYRSRITMHQDDYDNPFFYLEVDSDNNVYPLNITKAVGNEGVVACLQEHIDKGDRWTEAELYMLRHIQSVMMNAQFDDLVSAINDSMTKEPSDDRQQFRLVDFLHDMVLDRAPLGVAIREISPFPNGELYINERWYVAARDDVELPEDEPPQLEVGIWDASHGLAYRYTSVLGETPNLTIDDVDEEDADDEPIIITEDEADVEELKEELGFNAPSRKDLKKISDILSQTWMYLNGITPIPIGEENLPNADE